MLSGVSAGQHSKGGLEKMAEKIVGYTRVSLGKQVDGFSLDGQKNAIQRFAEYRDYEIKEMYNDEGKSGKSIDGRDEFQKMLEDIAVAGDIEYVVVFKLSRFGRNARDILNSLEYIRRYGVELYSVEDGIDTKKSAGKLLVTVLSAVSEIERENIIVQTMLGREQKARKGGWNGGFAPYGYVLEDGKLQVKDSQAEVIKLIFTMFLHENRGYSGVARWLNIHGYKREDTKNKHNRKFDDWTTYQVKRILDNPLYTGRIAYGRRRTKKIIGTENEYRLEKQEDYILSDVISHTPLISDEDFELVKKKRKATGVKGNCTLSRERAHLLSGMLKCPQCGSSMFCDKNMWTNKDGTKRETFSYVCSHYKKAGFGGSCSRNGVACDVIEKEVLDYTKKLLNNEEFATDIKSRIGKSVDLSEIDSEIAWIKKQLSLAERGKRNLERDIDSILESDKHAERKRADLNRRLDEAYDKLAELEEELSMAEEKKEVASREALTIETIYKMLMSFDTIYDKMDDRERRELVQSMITEIHLYTQEERKGKDTYVKSIIYSFPINDKVLVALRDRGTHVETIVKLEWKA